MKEVSVIYAGYEKDDDLFESLARNLDWVKEVILPNQLVNSNLESLPIKPIETNGRKGGALLNTLLCAADGEYVFLVKPGVSFEEEFLLELLEEAEETKAVIVYPNLILDSETEQSVKNYLQPFKREISLVASLALEDFVPEAPLLFRKDVFEKLLFDEFLEEYEVYDFIYRGIRKGILTLRLSELSYANSTSKPLSACKTIWGAFVLRNRVLGLFDWKKEIFPFLSWDANEKLAASTALTMIGKKLISYSDFFNAFSFLKKSLILFHNQESLKELIGVLVKMGEFDKALSLVSEVQGMGKEEIDFWGGLINDLKNLVEELEKAVKEGKIMEAVIACKDAMNVYSGAPIYNTLGVAYWLLKREEEARSCFCNCFIMNPANQDYLYNFSQLFSEEEVNKYISLIFGDANAKTA